MSQTQSATHTANNKFISSLFVVLDSSWLRCSLESREAMVSCRVRRGAVAVVSPRVPTILFRPSPPGEATVLSQKEGAVAVVCPRVPAILPQPSSPGEATVLSEKDLDWLQSGVVFPPPPAPQKGRRSVPWRQIKRRERRALKFGYSTSVTLKCPRSTLPCKYSGVSGLLPHGRFKRLERSAASGPATPPPEAVRRPTLAPTAWGTLRWPYLPHH